MKSMEFLKKIISFRASPLLAVPHQDGAPESPPKVWIVCFGESGRRIWIHLVAHGVTSRAYPLILDSAEATYSLVKSLKPEKLTIVSRLDDLLLWRLIKLVEAEKVKSQLDGYFIQPIFEQTNAAMTIPVVRNQRRAQKLFTNVRIFSKLDFEKQDVKPQWPVKWLDEKMDDSEKQIVWELVKP